MIPRFTRAERALHWATGLAVLTCAVTGFVLYVGWPPALIGRRTLLREVHVVAGVLMPVPLVLAYAGRWRAAVRADVRRLARWTRADRRWLLSRGRDATGEVGKFNAGQKANAAFVAGMIPIMLATGVIMRWYDPLGVDIAYRTGATFVHDWTAIATWVIVAGHIVLRAVRPHVAAGHGHGPGRPVLGGGPPSPVGGRDGRPARTLHRTVVSRPVSVNGPTAPYDDRRSTTGGTRGRAHRGQELTEGARGAARGGHRR